MIIYGKMKMGKIQTHKKQIPNDWISTEERLKINN
jgi:hypothetical protein